MLIILILKQVNFDFASVLAKIDVATLKPSQCANVRPLHFVFSIPTPNLIPYQFDLYY